jgi:hypothetical protein
LDVVERPNEALGTYELRIKRDLVDVSLARSPSSTNGDGNTAGATQQAYAYRVELSRGGVMASASGLDQPEVVLPQLCMRLLSHANVEPVGSRTRSEGHEAFQAALDATRLERGIEDRTPGRGAHEEEDHDD